MPIPSSRLSIHVRESNPCDTGGSLLLWGNPSAISSHRGRQGSESGQLFTQPANGPITKQKPSDLRISAVDSKFYPLSHGIIKTAIESCRISMFSSPKTTYTNKISKDVIIRGLMQATKLRICLCASKQSPQTFGIIQNPSKSFPI